jgi:cyclopropane-fatty-acyl-phospholipid synthase
VRRLIERVPRNTIRGSQRHIAGHYDLGNDLFAAFLDETMTYSCAAFDTPGMSLREAQEAKLERVCRKLELTP